MRTLVLGMGNPILCDDAVGIRLARDFRVRLQAAGHESASGSGLDVDIIADLM